MVFSGKRNRIRVSYIWRRGVTSLGITRGQCSVSNILQVTLAAQTTEFVQVDNVLEEVRTGKFDYTGPPMKKKETNAGDYCHPERKPRAGRAYTCSGKAKNSDFYLNISF